VEAAGAQGKTGSSGSSGSRSAGPGRQDRGHAATSVATRAGSAEAERARARDKSDSDQAERARPERGVLGGVLDALGIGKSDDVGLKPDGPPLSRDQEKELIDRGWR
jgi:hypothetical protein